MPVTIVAHVGDAADHMGGWGWGMMLSWMILGTVLLGVIVWAVAAGARSEGGGSRRNADELLAERYARGEIDTEEFERRRQVLRGH